LKIQSGGNHKYHFSGVGKMVVDGKGIEQWKQINPNIDSVPFTSMRFKSGISILLNCGLSPIVYER